MEEIVSVQLVNRFVTQGTHVYIYSWNGTWVWGRAYLNLVGLVRTVPNHSVLLRVYILYENMLADRQKSLSFCLINRVTWLYVLAAAAQNFCRTCWIERLFYHTPTQSCASKLDFFHFIIMSSKRQHDQWKNARAASLQTFKKRKPRV